MATERNSGGERACVVGAGPGGLATAAVFLDDGFDVTIFEKADEIGGTWAPDNRYLELSHQLPPGVAELIGKRWGDGYADAERFQAYLREYAEEAGLLERVRFETAVTDLTREDGAWVATTRDRSADGPATDRHRFEYAVVCSGAHHVPKRIDLAGQDTFDGEVCHSSEVNSPAQLTDADVLVIGCGKSAADIATSAAERAASTTMVFRSANWLPPKRFWGVVPQHLALYTRLGEALLPRYYNPETWRWLDRLPWAVKRLSLKALEHGVYHGAGYDDFPAELVPESSILAVQRQGVMPDGFARHVREGTIVPERATVDRLSADGAVLSTGEFVPADVVVQATGYRNAYPFLSESVPLKNDDGQFALYRGIVPPETEGLGIIGRRETLNNFLSMHLSAHWLSAYFRDELVETPTPDEMRATVRERLDWMDENVPINEGYYYGVYDLHAADELLVDMGVPTRRRRTVLSEWLGVNARGSLYDDVGSERRAAAAAPDASPMADASGPYLSSAHLLSALAGVVATFLAVRRRD